MREFFVATAKRQGGKLERQQERERWRRAAAAVIAATRRDKDMTQEDFGARMGWSHDTVANTETGRRKIEFGDIVMSAIVLGEKPDTLIQRILHWNSRAR